MTFHGRAVSLGVATGQVYLGYPVPDPAAGREPGPAGPGDDAAAGPGDDAAAAGPTAADAVRAAFAAVTAERFALAGRLRGEEREDQAAIVEIGALMAGDPALVDAAVAAVTSGTGAVAAVTGAASAQADILAALPNEDLAARADDVRQIGQAVVAQLTAGVAPPPPPGDFVLIQREVDPADLIRLADVGLTGAVSVSGGASSHAAIIARSLGLPMLAGVDPAALAALAAAAGHPALLDAADPAHARLVVDPDPAALPGPDPAAHPAGLPGPAAPPATADLTIPGASPVHRTADGQEVTLLVNAASAREVRLGLEAGAAGVGLLRTEIPFLRATVWPTRAEHEAALHPSLSLLAGRPAVVRLLDFSGDKVPPFLAGQEGPGGLRALLSAPEALADQLGAVLAAGRDTELRIMVPMVTSADELAQVGAALTRIAAQEHAERPVLGMMVEVASAAADAAAFAGSAGFFSVGTNDLTCEVLGIARADPRMSPALAADPRVLALLARVTAAAAAAGIPVSVCGDSAADPDVLPLLLGLGIRAFSVGAARVPQVAAWIAT
ncbi:MAG TPA: putative PEP-binding protein, partial [Streptosporangiaceae bacterium]